MKGCKSKEGMCFPNPEESNAQQLLIYLCSSHGHSVASRSEALVIA